MSYYRFTLNDFVLLEDQPKGWDQMKINIKRDSFYNALYLMYMSDLTFWGEGWNFCKNIIDTVGICGKIDVLIEVDRAHNGQYKTLFEGVADFTEADIDYDKCEIRVTVKDDFMLKTLVDRSPWALEYTNQNWNVKKSLTHNGSDVDIEINDNGVMTNISSLGYSIARDVQIFDITTGVDIPALWPFDSYKVWAMNYTFNYTVPYTRSAYKVIDALRYHLAIMTDNLVTVESDFFSNVSYQEEIWEIDFAATTINATTSIFVEYYNAYGRSINFLVPYNTSRAQTIQDVADKLLEWTDFDTIGQPIMTMQWAFGNDKFAFVDTGTADKIFAHSFLPFNLVRVEVMTAVPLLDEFAVLTKTQEITYGMANLFMGFDKEIAGDPRQNVFATVTFDQLFKALDSHFDLGQALIAIGNGQYELRIEPKSYFYSQPEIIDVGGIINVKSEPNKDLFIKGIVVGDKASDVVGSLAGKKQAWAVDDCDPGQEDHTTELSYDAANIGHGITFFLVKPDEINYGISFGTCNAERYQCRIMNSNGAPSAPYYDMWKYNAGMMNYWSVVNHLFRIAGSPQTAYTEPITPFTPYVWIVNNNDDAKNRLSYEFETILTDNEIQVIKNVPFGSVGFETKTEHLSKGIYEMEWDVNTGKTKFTLFG